MIVTIIQINLFTFYIGFIWIKYGIQKSISETWYILESKYQWMFTLILCFGVGICQLLHHNIYLFISGIFLGTVGVASDFKNDKIMSFLHYIGAIGSILFSFIGLWNLHLVEIPLILGALWLALYGWKNWIWWAEIITFYAIMLGLIL